MTKTDFVLDWLIMAVCAVILAALLMGCGDNTPAEVPAKLVQPFPECNPPPDSIGFHDEVCPGYGDVGVCHWLYADGRDITVGDCWSPTVNTCLWSCKEVTPS